MRVEHREVLCIARMQHRDKERLLFRRGSVVLVGSLDRVNGQRSDVDGAFGYCVHVDADRGYSAR